MQVDYLRIWPYLIALLALLIIYRRLRRSFGRQLLVPVRMRIRIVILSVLACVLVPVAFKSAQFLAGEMLGIACGIALGIWGARRTRYQKIAGQLYYVPHTYTGVAVSLLLIGRLVFRFMELRSASAAAGPSLNAVAASGFASGAMVRSPLTIGLLFVVIGYYICYYGLVLWKYKRIAPEDLEAISASPTA